MKKTNTAIAIDTKETFDKIQHSFIHNKTFQQTRKRKEDTQANKGHL